MWKSNEYRVTVAIGAVSVESAASTKNGDDRMIHACNRQHAHSQRFAVHFQ